MKARKVVGTAFTLLLMAALLYWFLRKADLHRVWQEAAGASLGFLAIAVAGEVASILLKAFRWGLMLRTVRARIPFAPLLKATVVSFSMTGVLPGRVGEVAKPFFLGRWLGLPFTPLLASVILERAMDLVAMVLLWVVFIFWRGPGVAELGASYLPFFDWATYAVLTAFVVGGAFLWWLMPRRENFEQKLHDGDTPQRHPWIFKVLKALLQFSRGLGMFQRKRDILAVVGCSLATWGILVVTSWAVVRAFGIPVSPSAGILILIFVNLGAGIPTPGGMGGVHKLIQVALVTFYAVGQDQAVAVGIVGHAVMFFPGILWGLLYLATGKVHLRELKEEMAVAQSTSLV